MLPHVFMAMAVTAQHFAPDCAACALIQPRRVDGAVPHTLPSFVFAGTATVPVSAGDHILFELTAKIDGELQAWSPGTGTVQKTRGTSSADIAVNAASIMMGVG